ncbi:uncharacterized protein AB675_2254 [Cyphellophora attinorum]|uniref:Zn(2)-C6 fungal-type domain-containing protein n=1 Tax=Cyphellophora attinorum TaxID=1664694 RepID=A0A0N1NXT2_9EURO|nr:uncharacterized protein AB675_2254 [Phialophora attinorum]KPI34883.1 hypothetical protein AB675_2254 [Phialophora attinorum]
MPGALYLPSSSSVITVGSSDMICPFCRKKFNEISSRKRHIYYCRTRQADPAPPRRRACEGCVTAKARCDLSQPCKRCSARQVDCHYAGAQPSKDGADRRRSKGSSPRTTLSSDEVFPPDPARPDTTNGAMAYGSLEAQPDVPITWRSSPLSHRRKRDVSASAITSLILDQLSTQLAMFRDSTNDDSHPLIHRSQYPFATGSPLVTCQVLLRSFAKTAPDRQYHVWDCIGQEADRIWFEHDKWADDDWLLISSLQAMYFYLLHRVVAGGAVHFDWDLPFLICMNQICKASKSRFEDATNIDHTKPHAFGYEFWAKYQVCKRLACALRILDLVVDISDAVSCIADPGYFLLPLPAIEVMWQAKGKREWQRVLQQQPKAKEVYGLSLQGQLKRLVDGEEAGTGSVVPDFSTWCSTQGHFGQVVRTAAILLSE